MRHFDAPEALDTRFYEVHAKSALNAVPKASRMPFPWTINPYRGCAHACVFCAGGDTAVLMADGRTRELRHIRPGMRIYGTAMIGRYRRYVVTRVLDHWMVRKPAYRVDARERDRARHQRRSSSALEPRLEVRDGRRAGPLQRPHLTVNNKLVGTGAFAEPPRETVDYKRGYLCGVIRGDGHIATRVYARPNGRAWQQNQFRLALTDLEALSRARTLPRTISALRRRRFLFAAAAERHREMRAIRTQSRASVEAIRELIAWPGRAPLDWYKGFLAGIFDAEGSFGGGIIRICNTDPTIIDWTTFACRQLGLPFVVETVGEGKWNVRIRGGLEQQLRFHHLTDPAITRKRSIEGRGGQVAEPAEGRLDRAARDGAAALRHHHGHGRLRRRRRGAVTTASPAPRTSTSTSTPAAISTRRSWSRSTCRRCCGSSWRGRRGSASTSRSGRTPTRTSGSRGATS